MLVRPGFALWAVVVGILVTACGNPSPSGSGSPTASAPTTAVDPCLVGTWRAASVTGALTDSSGSTISISGGSGGVLTIDADATLHIDDRSAKPDSGTAADGTVYTITSTGSGSGHVQSSAGQLTVILDATAAITQTISRNGSPVASQRPSRAVDTYTCARGSSLVITSPGGIVSTYAPAG